MRAAWQSTKLLLPPYSRASSCSEAILCWRACRYALWVSHMTVGDSVFQRKHREGRTLATRS